MIEAPKAPSALRPFWPSWAQAAIQQEPYIWNLDWVGVDPAGLTIVGWAPPFEGRPGNARLRVNGSVTAVEFKRSPEVQLLMPYWPNAALSQFETSVPLADPEAVARARDDIVIVAEPVDSRGPVAAELSRRIVYNPRVPVTVPPADLCTHIGGGSSFFFRSSGRTLYAGLRDVLLQYAGRDFRGFANILDWGCGTARIGVHLLDDLGPAGGAYVGVDIDEPAIAWANGALGPHFRVCRLNPPLAADAGRFDLVFAYSVFTHLAREHQDRWLAEMRRVAAPGAMLLFTVMSDLAMLHLSPYAPDSLIQRWLSDGIYDDQENDQLRTIGIGGSYYRNVWHTKPYLREHWGEFFEIVDIVENFHFYQDLVICRRR